MEKQLPNNWVETELRTIVWFNKGKKPKRLENQFFQDSIPYMDIMALEKNQISQYADIASSKKFKDEDIAIVWDGARSGWVAKARAGAIGSTIAALSPIKINNNYLYYFLLGVYPKVNSKSRGIGIPHVDPILFWSIPFPLPPLAEQERIAAKLDALFGQLDSIKGAMDRIPTLIANLRQQILTYAITGKLTLGWREGKNIAKWMEKPLNKIALPKSGYPFKASDFTNEGLQVIRMGNLYGNKLSLDRNPVFVPFDYDAEVVLKSQIKTNDVLLTLTGTKYKRDYGYAVKVNTEDLLLVNQRILALTPLIEPDFLVYLLRGDSFRDVFFSLETGGVNQGNVGIRNLLSITVSIPSKPEQEQIVQRVRSLFDKLETIESQYNTLKRKITNLPQAILYKAFKGELVEQLSTDGNAAELLYEIGQLKKTLKKK